MKTVSTTTDKAGSIADAIAREKVELYKEKMSRRWKWRRVWILT